MKRLIIMVRPSLDKWIKFFLVFASSGAASCDELYSLVIAVIIRLEVDGGRYFSIFSEKASSNNIGSWLKREYST
jgi:hypothetical protein